MISSIILYLCRLINEESNLKIRMKERKYFIISAFIIFLSFSALAQRVNPYTGKVILDSNYVDTSTTMVWASANFSYQIPFGKGYLATTFKHNLNIGANVVLKTASNWTFDAYFNYMFGSDLKCDPEEIFGDMINSNGDIIDGNGMKATIYPEGRYWSFGAGLGKIIPVSRWKNSGIWIQNNFGYFGHKIQITDPDNLAHQIEQHTYRKGYDQRSGGFCMSQFIGYTFMRHKRVVSFYAGVEITEMWTKPNRNYVFVLGPTDALPRKFSGLISFKIGWNIPLYEKKLTTTLYTN